MEDFPALARLYGLTIKPYESNKMFQQRIQRHKQQLAESLKTEAPKNVSSNNNAS